MLEKIEETLAGIKNKLLADELIRKLLFNDSNNALNMLAPLPQLVEDYITLKPVFDFENKEEYAKNSVINIYTTQIIPGDETKKLDGVIQINVVCNEDKWELVDLKIRPIQICNRIIKLVNNHKFAASNKLVFDTMTDLIISKKLFGYALLFEVTDGSGKIDKF